MTWRLEFSKAAAKDVTRLETAGLKPRAQELLEVIRRNPWQNPPPYEKLIDELAGAYSRRITRQHRLVYRVNEDSRSVDILRLDALRNQLLAQ